MPSSGNSHPRRTHVRTRQGCLTCRKRRRKCDEQKPRCQNCTGRGLECRYGLRLTFLAGNHSNLAPEDAQALRGTAPSVYSQITFVNGSSHGLEDTPITDGVEQPHHETRRPSELPPYLSPRSQELNSHLSRGPYESSSSPTSPQSQSQSQAESLRYADEVAVIEDQGFPEEDHNPDEPYIPQQASFSFPYPTLGASPSRPPISSQAIASPTETRNYDRSVLDRLSLQSSSPIVSLNERSRLNSTSLSYRRNSQPVPTLDNFETPSREHVSSPSTLENSKQKELLKFYIDAVAPRLDVCNSENFFGIRVALLAKEYPPLLHALLALAAKQQSSFMPIDSAEGALSAELSRQAVESLELDKYSTREESITAGTLLMISQLMSTQPQNWRSMLNGRIHSLGEIGINRFSEGLRSSMWWMILRLANLALSIFHETPLMTAVTQTNHTSSPPSNDLSLAAIDKGPPEWPRRAILLCSQAVRLCFASDIPNSSMTSQPFKDTWTTLWKATTSWSESLPLSMHPILQSPISTFWSPPASFPLVLFTSHVDMFSAVIYHITCILLLQNTPFHERRSSHTKNPTWHAVQICGICVGNNANWSYDPLIIAALVYAGRFISFQGQKEDLLGALRKLVKGSEWQVGSAIDDLVDRWRVNRGELDAERVTFLAS